MKFYLCLDVEILQLGPAQMWSIQRNPHRRRARDVHIGKQWYTTRVKENKYPPTILP